MHELQTSVQQRRDVLTALQCGQLTVAEAHEAWCKIIRDAAVSVFGVSAGDHSKMQDGRPAKRWFKFCKEQWLVLKSAIRRGDTHAAAAARKVFNSAKRRAKRYCEKQWNARLMDDLLYNPRRFWTAYKSRKFSCMQHDVHAVRKYWQLLCGAPGQHSLPETASSVTDYVSLLVQSVPSCSKVEAAQVLNEAFTVEEIEGALHKMHYGRMAGPDGLKGELFKGAYTEVPLSDGKVKHFLNYLRICRLFCLLLLSEVKSPPDGVLLC